jgi:hypothetical protein
VADDGKAAIGGDSCSRSLRPGRLLERHFHAAAPPLAAVHSEWLRADLTCSLGLSHALARTGAVPLAP